jgi:RimJ/RimL family protein N-acetyltransferase
MLTPQCKLPDPATLYQDLHDDEIPGYIREASDFLTRGDAKSCINLLNHSPIKDVASPWGWIVAATAHCKLGNHKTALGVAARGLQHTGENSYLFDCMGVAHAGLHDLISAQHYFQKSVGVDSHNGNSVTNLINIYLIRNAIDAAFEAAQQGLRQNPVHAEIRQLFVQLHPAWATPLECGKIRIRPRGARDDAFLLQCYANDGFMTNYNRYLANSFRRSQAVADDNLKSRLSVYKRKCVQWIVEKVDRANPEQPGYSPIGLASLAEIQLTHRRAEILLGFPDAALNGSGIPLTAMLMIFDFVFNTIGLNKLTSIVYAANAHAQKSTLALGFKQEGFFKNHLYDPKLKTWVDTHQNALLIEEFKSNARLAKFSARLLSATHTTPESDSLFGRLDAASF